MLAVVLLLLVLLVILIVRRRRHKLPLPTPGHAYLESVNRPAGPTRCIITPNLPATVGRGRENRLRIDETYPGWESVSRKHAEIRMEDSYYILHDLQSTNGTYVNGLRSGVNRLRDGVRIRFGHQVEFIFHENRPSAGAA